MNKDDRTGGGGPVLLLVAVTLLNVLNFGDRYLIIAFSNSIVMAWAGQIEGKVKSVDQSDRTVTLEDCTRSDVPQGMDLDQLREGAEITVSYEEKDGQNQATNVQVK